MHGIAMNRYMITKRRPIWQGVRILFVCEDNIIIIATAMHITGERVRNSTVCGEIYKMHVYIAINTMSCDTNRRPMAQSENFICL